MKSETKTKNAPTAIVTPRSHQRCSRGVNAFFRNGMITSCTIVEEALKIRESSVESISMIISSVKSPISALGRKLRSSTGIII